MYLNCGERYEFMIDHCSYTRNLSSEIKAWKKFRPDQDSNPWPLRYHCSALPTELSRWLSSQMAWLTWMSGICCHRCCVYMLTSNTVSHDKHEKTKLIHGFILLSYMGMGLCLAALWTGWSSAVMGWSIDRMSTGSPGFLFSFEAGRIIRLFLIPCPVLWYQYLGVLLLLSIFIQYFTF